MSVFHIPDDPEMKKKNWVSFNKYLRLHFVKKNPTFSNREIQCEKSDTCHCHTLYYYHIFFCLSKKNLFVRKNWKLLGKNLKQRKQRNEKKSHHPLCLELKESTRKKSKLRESFIQKNQIGGKIQKRDDFLNFLAKNKLLWIFPWNMRLFE